MKTEDCYGSQHHHEIVKQLDLSHEDHEISMKMVRIFNICCHHLFPSGADVIQMDGRDSFIDWVEIIAQYQPLQIQNEREV